MALVGGAAEMASAFAAARRDNLDLSVGIALGAASQIALFVAPVLVLLSYVLGPAPMDLRFWPGSVVMMLVATVTMSLVASAASAVVDRSNQELIDIAAGEARAALPAARGARLLRATVVRERRATFSTALSVPARPQTRTPIPGLFLAGDWIDTGLPATIEGAVVSGHRAATAVMEYLAR